MAKKEPIDIGIYLENWEYGRDINELRRRGRRVTPEDFAVHMKDHLYCYYCGTNITRRPLNEPRSRDGKPAYFAHIPTFKEVECDRRVKPAPGFDYVNEEDARRAVERNDLVIVPVFATEPQHHLDPAGQYAGGPVEDPQGPRIEIPIARHIHGDFEVAALQRTVAGICRNLDRNLHRHYQLPGMQQPQLLRELLHNAAEVHGPEALPKLYFGKILRIVRHVRQTTIWLEHHPHIADFALTANIRDADAKGFYNELRGRYAIFWGAVVDHGISWAVRNPAWGEFDLVAAHYTALLDDLRLGERL